MRKSQSRKSPALGRWSSREPSSAAAASQPAVILVVNGGSSSIKFGVYSVGSGQVRLLWGELARTGESDAKFTIQRHSGFVNSGKRTDSTTGHDIRRAKSVESARALLAALANWLCRYTVVAVAHRVVHEGIYLAGHQKITARVLTLLKRSIPIDPAHLPLEIALIEAAKRRFPGSLQYACLDSAFHEHLPSDAQRLPIPRRYARDGLRRFGFHGLSYSYLMKELLRRGGTPAVGGRVLLAHLGAGSSMAAVKAGKPLDTTMGFTPTAGLVMATRPGDLDPGLLVYLMRAYPHLKTAAALDRFINAECGMLGISESTGDMQTLLVNANKDVRAADAVNQYVYAARKNLGSMVVVMGGLDTLVFSGGIGEHATEIRARICSGLEFLGIRIDRRANRLGKAIISTSSSRVTVRVIPTDEERLMVDIITEALSAGTLHKRRTSMER
ncbi:MAG: acetate/propionate family kinase [Phycisphaerales bacterium]|nr:acetate/propionate family kinase [Phycisphaerales bacterium]